MKGVEYVVDDKGKKKAVLIDLETHRDRIEPPMPGTVRTVMRSRGVRVPSG